MKCDRSIQYIREKSLDVYNHFLGKYYSGGKVIPGKNISNPFLTEKQNTPSFNIYKGFDRGYIFKDFATGDLGDVITFVQRIKKLERKKAIQFINRLIL